VIIGMIALAGVWIFYSMLDLHPLDPGYFNKLSEDPGAHAFLVQNAGIVLLMALLTGIMMAKRKARKMHLPLWDATARRLIVNMLIPLLTGGIFCIILSDQQHPELLAPVTLIFYGLALVNASKYSINEIRYLGIWEIASGLVASYYIDYGLLAWAFGFGILHIIYGIVIYYKHEQ
jgi:vacuolar-type H+-ATPase subunit I/STV1